MARALSAERNRLRLESCHDDPEGLEKVKKSNLETCGYENCPPPISSSRNTATGKSSCKKAFGTNVAMDACVGLYDTCYALYIELGMIKE